VKAQLKKLTADSAVYGVSNIVGRFITFLLVPFYSHTLPQADYGIVTAVYSLVAFLNAMFTFGLEPAYMRFVTETDTAGRNRIFSTVSWFIAAASVVLAGAILLFEAPVQSMLEIGDTRDAIIPLALGMITLDAVNVIPFAALRMENRARMFATIKITSIVINVGLNILFIAFLHWSIVSIFLSGVIASLVSTLLLLPVFLSHGRARIDRGLLRDLLRYGLPTMPGAVAIMLVEVIDKPIMLKLAGAATTGVYSVNYKLGIFMMLVVTVFRYAWQPFYLQMKDSAETRRLFARVLTYFVLVAAAIVLVLSLFIGDLVRIPIPMSGGRRLINPDFLGGIGIVPIILFSYVWAGIAQILNAGLYIEKRTRLVLAATASGAAVNIAANFLLIPAWGMYGGAAATFAAYFTITAFYAVAVRRIFPVPWEYGRLLRIGIALAVSALLWYLVPAPAWLGSVAWRIAILAGFAGTLLLSGFFLGSETAELRRILLRRRN
jgi:O-antigen/teichoic acid export membrane protein